MSQINESLIKTPGVYINEIPSFPPSIPQVATAVPAFVGYTAQAQDAYGNSLTKVPTRITSLLEYETYFGLGQEETNLQITYTQKTGLPDAFSFAFAATGASRHNMHSAIRFFYDNGGGPCYIVSVGPYTTPVGAALDPTLFAPAIDTLRKEDEPTLIVIPEAQNLPADTDCYAAQAYAMTQCADLRLQDRFTIMDLFDTGATLTDSTSFTNAINKFRADFSTPYPNYGAAYFPNLRTVYPYDIDETKVILLNTLDGTATTLNNQTLNALSTANTAVYNLVKQTLNLQFRLVLPPSPAMAGIYAAVDGSRGVWKAPANWPVQNVSGTTFQINDELQETMNIDPATGLSVNALRAFTGKGTLVWGSRTLDGNSNDFRYVPVRRFYISVEKSVKLAMMAFVFEPNDGNTWVKVRAMIENYLTNLWRQGALAGSKPEQAFYVKVGLGQTMIFDDILNGRMIVEIGMAPVRPAEFIILRFTQIQQQS